MWIAWILEQQEREDSTGRLARLIWSDINNGCGNTFLKTVVDWNRHFEAEHPRLPSLKPWFASAYTDYLLGNEEQ